MLKDRSDELETIRNKFKSSDFTIRMLKNELEDKGKSYFYLQRENYKLKDEIALKQEKELE